MQIPLDPHSGMLLCDLQVMNASIVFLVLSFCCGFATRVFNFLFLAVAIRWGDDLTCLLLLLARKRTRHTNKDMISPTLKHHKPPRNKEKLQTHLQDLATETVERFGLLFPSTIQTCLQWEGQINEQIDQSKCWCRKWHEEESQSRPTHHLMIPLCVPLPCAAE
jgi:type III secretory pathway component EscV